jgi:hypothetical protein
MNQELITRVTQQLKYNHAVEAQDIRTLLEAYKTLPKVVEFLREYYFGNMDLTELQKNDLVDLITELEQL